MKKISLIMAALMLAGLFAGCSMLPGAAPQEPEEVPQDEAAAPEYSYIAADELKQMIENGDSSIIIDIQPQEYFDLAHLPGSVSTGAYPADTDELRAKLEKSLETINEKAEAPVIIVGLGGKTGAENAADYYMAQGVAADRLKILEGGAISWPYEELKWATHEYQYITPDELLKKMDDGDHMMIIDVRQKEAYDAGYIRGSIPTYSFPNDNRAQWDSLDALTEDIEKTLNPIVVVCMSGKKGAVNAINYYATKGIDPRKFLILEGGGEGWPYPEKLDKVPALQYITPEDVKAKLEAREEAIILSVQTKENYREVGHLPNSIATYAYPADNEELLEDLEDEVEELTEKPELPIWVMSHEGKEGAANAIAYYVNEHKIDAARFFVIEGGIAAWPYPEMLEQGR